MINRNIHTPVSTVGNCLRFIPICCTEPVTRMAVERKIDRMLKFGAYRFMFEWVPWDSSWAEMNLRSMPLFMLLSFLSYEKSSFWRSSLLQLEHHIITWRTASFPYTSSYRQERRFSFLFSVWISLSGQNKVPHDGLRFQKRQRYQKR